MIQGYDSPLGLWEELFSCTKWIPFPTTLDSSLQHYRSRGRGCLQGGPVWPHISHVCVCGDRKKRNKRRGINAKTAGRHPMFRNLIFQENSLSGVMVKVLTHPDCGVTVPAIPKQVYSLPGVPKRHQAQLVTSLFRQGSLNSDVSLKGNSLEQLAKGACIHQRAKHGGTLNASLERDTSHPTPAFPMSKTPSTLQHGSAWAPSVPGQNRRTLALSHHHIRHATPPALSFHSLEALTGPAQGFHHILARRWLCLKPPLFQSSGWPKTVSKLFKATLPHSSGWPLRSKQTV